MSFGERAAGVENFFGKEASAESGTHYGQIVKADERTIELWLPDQPGQTGKKVVCENTGGRENMFQPGQRVEWRPDGSEHPAVEKLKVICWGGIPSAMSEQHVQPNPGWPDLFEHCPAKLKLQLHGSSFIICSDKLDFVQGALTREEAYKLLAPDLEKYMKRCEDQKLALLMDFEGEMPGHSGELYFAQLRATKVLEWADPGCITRQSEANQWQVPGLLLDMASPANLDLIKRVLANEKILKVSWGSRNDLESLIHHTPLLGHAVVRELLDVVNLLDAQISFSINEKCLVSLSNMISLVNQEFVIEAPSWDHFHKRNERANRRPFSMSFLEYGAMNLLQLEVILASKSPGWSYPHAFRKTGELIRQVKEDKFGLGTLLQDRRKVEGYLRNAELGDQQAARVVRYLRHWASISSSTDALQKLCERGEETKCREISRQACNKMGIQLPQVSADGPHPSQAFISFEGDWLDSIISLRLLQDVQRSWEATSQSPNAFQGLFPDGVHIVKFRRMAGLRAWKEKVEQETTFCVRQDETAFFLEVVADPMVIREKVASRKPKDSGCTNQVPAKMFRSSDGQTCTESAGPWWCLVEEHWDGPGNTSKRALQFLAWCLRKQPLPRKGALGHLMQDCVVISCQPLALPRENLFVRDGAIGHLAPRDIECHYSLDWNTLTFIEERDKWLGRRVHAQRPLQWSMHSYHQGVPRSMDVGDPPYLAPGVNNLPWPMALPLPSAQPACFYILFLREGQGHWKGVHRWTYEAVESTIREEGEERGLPQYLVEYKDQEQNMTYKFCQDNFAHFQHLFCTGSPPVIHLRVVKLVIDSFDECEVCEETLAGKANHAAIEEIEADTTFEAIQDHINQFVKMNGLDYCVLGYQAEKKFQELTQDTMPNFLALCHKDQPDPESFGFHVQLRPVFLSMQWMGAEARPPQKLPLKSLVWGFRV